jgi:hypothetical protein
VVCCHKLVNGIPNGGHYGATPAVNYAKNTKCGTCGKEFIRIPKTIKVRDFTPIWWLLLNIVITCAIIAASLAGVVVDKMQYAFLLVQIMSIFGCGIVAIYCCMFYVLLCIITPGDDCKCDPNTSCIKTIKYFTIVNTCALFIVLVAQLIGILSVAAITGDGKPNIVTMGFGISSIGAVVVVLGLLALVVLCVYGIYSCCCYIITREETTLRYPFERDDNA